MAMGIVANPYRTGTRNNLYYNILYRMEIRDIKNRVKKEKELILPYLVEESIRKQLETDGYSVTMIGGFIESPETIIKKKMITKEDYVNWLTKSYLDNLSNVDKEIKNLVGQSFKLGALELKLDDTNLGELQKSYVELFEALARGFVAGVKLGTSFEHCNEEDLERIMKDNPEGLQWNKKEEGN